MGKSPSDDIECPKCGRLTTLAKLYEYCDPSTSGKHDLICPNLDCQKKIDIQFHCSNCKCWHTCRSALKPDKYRGVTKYRCTECDGWIRRGEVLDVRQGIYQ